MIFDLDIRSEKYENDRYWEFCVGSCHAATALRADYRAQLEQCRRELGFRYVRFHGLFDDDMSVMTKKFDGSFKLSFANIDNIFDFLLGIGMKPFVELSFMPSCLKTGEQTIFHYKGVTTPPNDPLAWEFLITSFVRHITERYGRDEVRRWFFEVWNEPNLGGEGGMKEGGFWTGSMADYYELYAVTAKAVKSVDEFYRVGGPATSNNAHISDMREYCEKNGVPLDFISTHHYPTDVVLGYGVENSRNFIKEFIETDKSDKEALSALAKEFVTFKKTLWQKVDRGVLTQMAKRARREAGDLPLFYTEWSSLAGFASDGSFGASFIAKTVPDNLGIVDGYAYWTFSDIFEEDGFPASAFSGGYGLLSIDGIPKAPYRAFQLLHKLGGQAYEKRFSEGTVDIYPFFDDTNSCVQLLCVNHNLLLHDIEEQIVEIELKGGDFADCAPDIIRVDDEHANALAAWEKAGRPDYLTQAQIFKLKAVSELKRETLAAETENGRLKLSVVLPAMGTALITVYLR